MRVIAVVQVALVGQPGVPTANGNRGKHRNGNCANKRRGEKKGVIVKAIAKRLASLKPTRKSVINIQQKSWGEDVEVIEGERLVRKDCGTDGACSGRCHVA